MKALIKNIFFKLGLSPLLDLALYQSSKLRNFFKNKKYKISHPHISLPPDYYLYETYKLDYKEYVEDGTLGAKEISEWTLKHIPQQNTLKVLEWGCGVSRICRHIHTFFPPSTQVFACDINKNMIDWNKKNIQNISFEVTDYTPPTNYLPNNFNMIFGLSVFTHIEINLQESWLAEIHRILNIDGIFLFSTHGNLHLSKLTKGEKEILNRDGGYSKSYYKKGHRLMSSYNDPDKFKTVVEKYFVVLEYYDGINHYDKLGGQDLWIVRKK